MAGNRPFAPSSSAKRVPLLLASADGSTFTWVNGRRLASATNTAENLTATYTYDSDGLRLTKTINGVEHKYLWQGSKLVSEYYDGKELEFFYDESGSPYAFSYKASSTATPVTYYYLTNLQGDITGILDASGTSVAAYTYNAWGKLLSSTGDLADVNPLRYRGYYYDAELEMYYLQSRYYDPEICRWINADSVIAGVGGSIQGYNMFAYCFNNPINMSDKTGTWPKWIKNAVREIEKAAKKVASEVAKAVSSIKSSFSPANHVQKTHVTTPTVMLNLGILIGKVGFSSTVTKQNKEPGLVHSASDIGNDASKYSAGINIVGWLGADVGVSSEINAFVSAQITPWVHGEVSVGLDGIGAVIGVDLGDTSYDFEINGGWGLIAIFFTPQIVASDGLLSSALAY